MSLLSKIFLTSVLLIGLCRSSVAANELEGSTLPLAIVEIPRNDFSATHLNIRVPSVGRIEGSTSEGELVNRFGLELEPMTTRPGWPELPMISRLILVPPTGGIQTTINSIESFTETGYAPFIVPVLDGTVDLDFSGSPSLDYLNTDGFWPPNPIEVGEPAILRGHRMVSVIVYPMQINPQTGEIKYNTNVDFELNYSGQGTNEITNPARPRPSSTIDRVLESLVINPPSLSRDDHQRGAYLLVYYNANGIANSLAPLITWRKRQGWQVETMAVQVNAQANDIKALIQRAYDEWDVPPEMIALVGDPDWGGSGIPAFANDQTDLHYARLEGNDILADADYGRISCLNIQELDRVVAKIVNYESNPFMDNTDWYRQGAVCAGNSISGLSTILVNKWVRRQTMDRGWQNVHEWYFNAPFQGLSVPNFFASEFARGISYATYRGWIGMEQLSPQQIMGFQATRRYPFATTMTCQSGQYIGTECQTEAFFRSPGGAIGSIGFATANTKVPYNNAVFTGIWHGLLKLGLYNIGSACNYGRYNTFRQYAGFEDQNVDNFSYWANLMGDPATEMFTDIPQIVNCEHEENVPLGTTRLTVRLTDDGGDLSIADAQVCLYKANDDFQVVSHTNESGIADFAIASDALSAGNLLITATRHNMKPYLGTISIGQEEQFFGAETWEIQHDDNEDGVANPGEEVTLALVIKNFGTEDLDDSLVVTFESYTDWATVGDRAIVIRDAPQHGESVGMELNVELDRAVPDRTPIPIGVFVTNGQTTWRSMAAIQAASPNLEVVTAIIANDRVDPGAHADIDFDLSNVGSADIGHFSAQLWSETPEVIVTNEGGSYPAIRAGRSARTQGDRFRIRAHPLAIPGMKAKLKLAIETNSGFRDTTTYMVNVGVQRVNAPFGPDKYGYICFDSGDEDWEMAPEYEWVEIDPNVQNNHFDGTLLNLQDQAEDADQSQVINLPFEFQYYGEPFNRGTVCTNGWFAFGNWGELSDFRNRRINSGEGPDGQLCVLWDDLRTGRILTYYDEANGRFIVEWNGMTSQGDGSSQTFELVLYDPDVSPTYSGDGMILFQYKDVNNSAGEGESHDTPYATVGINSPTDLDGLEYTYYNSYAMGAKRLEDRLAIKFTTGVQFISGVLAVQVSDANTGAAIENAQITTDRGFWGETDQEGIAYLDDILAGHYDRLTVSAQGFNDSSWFGDNEEGFNMAEAETLWFQLGLLHPEFTLEIERVDQMMLPDSSTGTSFSLLNTGNGPLNFTSRYSFNVGELLGSSGIDKKVELGRDDPDEQWDILLSWNASEPIENSRLQGLSFIGDHWVVVGGHIGNEDTLNYFYEFSRNGQFNGNRIPQTTTGAFGYRDLEFDSGLMFAAYFIDRTSIIVAIDPVSYQIVSQWKLPADFRNIRNLAIDPATGHFWVSSTTSGLYEMEIESDTTMVAIGEYPVKFPGSNEQIHGYGLSWFRDDPDGYQIYIISNHESGVDPNAEADSTHADVALFKMNPLTGEIRFVTDFGLEDAKLKGNTGMVITPKWNNLVWGLATILDSPEGDQVHVFELANNSSWISYEPHEDTLGSFESVQIEMSIESTDLDTGRYSVIIEFLHNADDGIARIPVTLDVVSVLENEAPNYPELPNRYFLGSNFPNPFNSVTMIDYALAENGNVKFELFDLQGRKIQSIVSGSQSAGQHRIAVDGSKLSTGLYFYRLEAGNFSATRKMIITK